MVRDKLKNAELLVIKVGSKVLLESDGRPNYPQIEHLVEQIATLHKRGRKIIFVSSGAIGAGMEALSLKKRPTELETLQAAASIGQVRLMRAYDDLFGARGVLVSQVLLTHDDLKNRKRHLNIKQTLLALLKNNVIPIINENDTVSVDEIKFGDNDVLASLVAMLLEARALILLTTADGFMITNDRGEKERLPQIFELDEKVMRHIESHKVGLSVGGMKSKLIAATNMIHVGGVAVIAPGKTRDVLYQIFSGENVGTVVGKDVTNDTKQMMPGRKRWIAFYQRPSGEVVVDDGAMQAITKDNRSLLTVGVVRVAGEFKAGAVINICSLAGECIAKGIVQCDHQEINLAIEQKDKDHHKNLKSRHTLEIVHRDNMVVFKKEK